MGYSFVICNIFIDNESRILINYIMSCFENLSTGLNFQVLRRFCTQETIERRIDHLY